MTKNRIFITNNNIFFFTLHVRVIKRCTIIVVEDASISCLLKDLTDPHFQSLSMRQSPSEREHGLIFRRIDYIPVSVPD